jgi:hypothetical protein
VIPIHATSSVNDTSIHRRHSQSSNAKHRRLSIASVVHGDSLGAVLPTDQVTLKRHLGLFSGVCFIIGTIIGKLLNLIFHVSTIIVSSYQVLEYLFLQKAFYEEHNPLVFVSLYGWHVD